MTAPHDRLFRYLFSPPGRAEALLRHNLPAPLLAEVDWSTLRRESGTLVDWQRETRQDLLFAARSPHSSENEPPHFFLIEHQSSVDRWMALRLHDYAWRLISHWRELHPRSRWIPEVTALVVYPRKGRRWSAPLRLQALCRPGARARGQGHHPGFSLDSRYWVDDLSTQSEPVVRARPGPPLVSLGLLVLSFGGTEELAERLPHWSDLFAQVYASTNGPQALYRIVRYLHQLGDEAAVVAVRRVLHSFMQTKRVEVLMRTMAEVLREQGHRQGLLEGEAKGEARGLAKALVRLLDARDVHVDAASRERIQRCMDVSTLERWLDRAVSATRISEVLDGPAQ